MINNNSATKFKAFKSSRDFEEGTDGVRRCKGSDNGELEEDKLSYIGNDKSNPLPTIVICQRDRPDNRLKSRPRLRDDFRMARGATMDRRVSNPRGRGGGLSRKMERESDCNISSGGKYHDSLNKGNSSESSISSKSFNDPDGPKPRLEVGYMVPEDSRISKLLRRLCREDDQEKFFTLCKQLQDSLMVPENGRYIRRSMDLIADSLLDLLHSGPGAEAKFQAARCLGRVGYAMEQDFKRYVEWVFATYAIERNEEVRLLLMKALLETLKLDEETLKLKEFSSLLMTTLQNALEYTDLPEFLIGTVDVILLLTEMYPSTFSKHFRDTVDILVGWHIDSTQKSHITNYASRSLQRLSRFWIVDMQFSLTLLSQFLEDMEAYGDDLTLPSSGRSSPADDPPLSPEQCVAKITSLIKVFNTVLKCLGQHLSPLLSPSISWSFLTNCFTKMLHTVLKVLDVFVKEDLIIAANECACLLLTYLQSKTSSGNVKLYVLINTELSLVPRLGEEAIISMLRMISKSVREVSANLPIELVEQLLSPTSAILQLRFSPSLTVQKEIVTVYHSLLNLKNIPPLQEAYRYVLEDLQSAYKIVVPSVAEFCPVTSQTETRYSLEDAEIVIMFHLRSLSDLANASNSIIGMWALKPSILELLAVKLEPYNESLMKFSPALQYALLYLLYSHCSRYNHFVSSSELVNKIHGMSNVCDILGLPLTREPDVPATSPTCGHLSIILALLSRILLQGTVEETVLLVLSWTQEVLVQAQSYLTTLQKTSEFCELISSLVTAGHTPNVSIVLSVLGNLEQLLGVPDVSWKPQLLLNIVDVCILHINATNVQVSEKVCKLFQLIPWHITIMRLSAVVEPKKNVLPNSASFSLDSICQAQRLYLSRGTCGEMQPQQFRTFMAYLLQGLQHIDEAWLQDMFCCCWPLLAARSTDDEKAVSLFSKLALSSNSVLLLWATWEAAQFCVLYKLRTPLGKPQDTFMSIEGVIKSLARELSQNNCHTVEDDSVALSHTPSIFWDACPDKISHSWELRRMRLLLEFVEQLEKATHNAAEGCATAMLPSPKPVRTFFHTNKSTCAEWLTRIRMAVVVVALHAGQSTAAVRHGHCLLSDLASSGNTQGVDFERAVMFICWALCKLCEPEAIQGLYAWCREQGRKFVWLKAAAEQASGRFEAAAEDYRKLLDQECSRLSQPSGYVISNSSPEKQVNKTDTVQSVMGFLADQLTECYTAVNNWQDLLQWKEKEKELWNLNNVEISQKYESLNNAFCSHAKILAELDETDFSALSELEKWNNITLPEPDKSWSGYKAFGQIHATLSSVAVAFSTRDRESSALIETVEHCLNTCRWHMQEGLRNIPSEFLQECTVSQYAANAMLELLHGQMVKNPFSQENCELNIDGMSSSLLMKVLWWSRYFIHASGSPEDEQHYQDQLYKLRMEAARLARKEGNCTLAQGLLMKILSSGRESTFSDMVQNIKTNFSVEQTCNIDTMRAFMEVSKLLYSSGNHEKAIQMCSVSALGLMQHSTDLDTTLREKGARSLLTLAKWLQQEAHLVTEIGDGLTCIFSWDDTHTKNDTHYSGYLSIDYCGLLLQNGTQVIPAGDVIVGRLLYKSVSHCPTLAKCWNQFASWCYRWGRKVVDAVSEAGGQLSEVDRADVKQLLPPGMPLQDLEKVYCILSQTRAVADEEDIESQDINTSEMIESQLQNVRTLNEATGEQLAHLVDIWRNSQKRMYIYYELSAIAYFKFLELHGDKQEGDCATITATLRLLRLIVKHALELQNVLESGLGTTPTCPWKGIIPQLFSRLSHPEPYVRRRVSELLCRVAEDAPHLITFPAVVGATAGGTRLREMSIATSTSRLFSTCLSQPSGEEDIVDDEEEEDLDEDECSNEVDSQVSVLKNCFLAMVDTLSKQAPDAISQVQLLVQELRRITLLWDELWLGTLAQHHAEISRRLTQLELEVQRVDNNPSLSPEDKEWLIAEKHRIILKPLFFILEQLHGITSVTPETPHEKWFQEKFGDYIGDALHKLKFPTNPRRPQESWQPMKQLQARLQQRSQKRTAYMIHMSDVSPALAALKETVIAMPGISSGAGKIITIAAIDNNIAILPTKTKPKKIAFHGSDGQMHTYLFKGLEDLHLDERIMQFLSIANTMMQQGSGTQLYQARHYSVIPLGPRSGLISWVDGVTPLFGLYKRWQQREAALLSLKSQSSSSVQTKGPTPAMRPSELFYSKLTPLLKEQGIVNLDNRKEWPHAILKQVLVQLMDETPKDLLSKELWCHSINAGSWWQVIRTYSYSVAVMSIIGYIIGLGDRHLDNVLVDLTSGEVVHIDYNVCFEKGKSLRVPEKVPFRMTPNISTALGVTGIEGIFRLACEHVLKIMKKGRETLLTLLEAFVYDPLIDWTPGNEAGYTGAVYGGGQDIAMETKQSRKELEREVTLAMFCVRVAEMKSDWLSNRDDLLAALPILEEQLTKWLQVQGHIKEVQEALQDFHQQMALVKEAEAHGPGGQHSLYSLAARFSKHQRAKDALEKAQSSLKEKLVDCEKHLNLHKVALSSVRGTQLAQWVAELNYPINKDSHLVFDLVKEFLQNAGQTQMIVQCEQSECELGQLSQQQNLLIRTCLDLLSQYGTVAGLYPASYLNTHRSVCFHHWVQYLLENMTVERCHEVRAQFQNTFSSDVLNSGQQVLTFSYQLQTALQDANVRFKKSYERMSAEGLPESNVHFEAAYREAHDNITKFLHGEAGAAIALECVTITALCTLNKRYLMMEAAAASAGDCLVDLTSRDGDWFLDEMYMVSSLVTELSGLLPLPGTDTNVHLVLQCLKSANSIYKGLQELNFNFHTIILPEALKTIQTEDHSVKAMVHELDDIIAGVGCPLSELLVQLEMHLRYIIMEMDSPHGNAQMMVSALRSKYESLLLHPADTSDISGGDEALKPGQMLLMGFNGLFEKLQLEGSALISALETLDTPACWKKVDQVREAKALAAPVFNDTTRAVLDDIFLLKRLQTMQEFFMLCSQMTNTIHDDDRLNKPIRRFTADYVSRQLLGVTSQTLALALCLLLQRIGLNVTVEVEQRDVGAESKVPLEELCHKAVDLCLKHGHLNGGVLAQASGLTSSLEMAWRRREVVLHIQQEVEARRATLQRLQLQLTAYHWLHEDILMHNMSLSPGLPLSRPNFMLELRKKSSTLLALQSRLSEAQEQQNSLVANVEQRLKWAAGVNPALNEVLAAFEAAVTCRMERLAVEQRLASLVGNTCSALLHHEALRTRTSEGVAHDAAFLQLVDQCEKSCLLAAGCDQTVTPAEESLMQLLPPKGQVDHTWIQNVEVLISGKVKTLQEQMVVHQSSLIATQECLKKQVMTVRSLLSSQHKLMLDVRNLLKSMAKFEDGGLVGLHDYLSGCRSYSEQFSSIIRDMMAEDIDPERVQMALEHLKKLKDRTGFIYEELLLFAKLQTSNIKEEENRPQRPPLLRQEGVCFSPRKDMPTAMGNQDSNKGKAVQERNAYALSVWRRVRMKLEGRDPDPGRRATVQEQVEYVIREAMSLDNLALLYEGWTPWV